MKKRSVFANLRVLFVRKKKKDSEMSVLSRKITQQGYQAKDLNTTARRKSVREKWQTRKEGRGRQSIGLGAEKDNRRKRAPFKLLLLTGILVTAGYFLTLGSWRTLFGDLLYFRVHEIEISGCVVTNAKELRKYADITYEMNMLTLQPGAIKERLERHPWVEQAKIRRIWPDGLLISIKEYRPQALVAHGEENGFQYLDGRGVLFATVASGQDLDFPVITGLDLVEAEIVKEQSLDAASSFLRLASQNNPSLPAQNISEIHFTPEGELIVYLVEQPFPIYFGKGEVEKKFSQLHRVLKVLYEKKKGKAIIEDVAFIRMDYQEDKVLVVRNHSG